MTVIPLDGFNGDAPGIARRVILVLLTGAYLILWIGGVGQHWLAEPARPGVDSWLAAIFLALAGLIVLLGTRVWREGWLLFWVGLLGYFAEVAGVHFGLPFGDYHYTGALGPAVLGVPLVMAFAWMTLAAYVKQMLLPLRLSVWVEVLVGAFWLTAFDLLIDPLAANELGFWRWASSGPYYGVPMLNFAGWFVVSLLVFTVMRGRFSRNVPARLVGLSLILFFSIIALAYGKLGVALVGAGLCTIHLVISAESRRLIPKGVSFIPRR